LNWVDLAYSTHHSKFRTTYFSGNQSRKFMSYYYRVGWLGINLSLLLLGCTSLSAGAPPNSPTPPSNSEMIGQASTRPSPTQENFGQVLPISAQAEISGQVIQLEVARTPEQQEMGLMHRPALPNDRGMLFPFEPPRPVLFWMENTPSPLDMVFLLKGEVKAIAANAPPCTARPCPTYGPHSPVDQVIELRSGRAAELGLKVGDRVTVRFLQAQDAPSPQASP
jgi:uncharacterized membrane protein (UPF0127 family)